jgi:hypothetical protein
MADFKITVSGLDKMQRELKALPDKLAKEALDKMERDARSFHSSHRGRSVADIQRDYKAKYGNALSADEAQAISNGAPLKVIREIKR